VHERYRRQTDRQTTYDRQTTDDRQTDGRQHIANVNVTSRSLSRSRSLKIQPERKLFYRQTVGEMSIYCVEVEHDVVGYRVFVYAVSAICLLPVWPEMAVSASCLFSHVNDVNCVLRRVVASRPRAQPLGGRGGADPPKFGRTIPTFLMQIVITVPLHNRLQCAMGIPSVFFSVQ